MNRTLSVIASAVVGAGAVVAVATTAAPSAVAAEGDLPSGYYSAPYSSAIFQWDEPNGILDQLTYDEWAAAGFPQPTSTASTSFYAKYPWSPGIVGVTFFTAPTSPDPEYYYEGLTGATWARAGNPTPEVVSNSVLPGSGVLQYRSSPEIFVFDASEVFHKLTYNEWSGLGQPSPASVGTVLKYSFDSTLYLYVDPTDEQSGSVVALDGMSWNRLANPTPAVGPNNRLPGDAVFAFTDDPGTLFLRTPTKQTRYLTYPQWVSMGQPNAVPVAPPATNAKPAATKAFPGSGRLATDTDPHRRAVQVLRKVAGLR